MLVRYEAARWSCRADELEEFFHGVADQLLQLMKARARKQNVWRGDCVPALLAVPAMSESNQTDGRCVHGWSMSRRGGLHEYSRRHMWSSDSDERTREDRGAQHGGPAANCKSTRPGSVRRARTSASAPLSAPPPHGRPSESRKAILATKRRPSHWGPAPTIRGPRGPADADAARPTAQPTVTGPLRSHGAHRTRTRAQ